MGTWDRGPFDNDDAADFLAELAESPARHLAKTLRSVATGPPDRYLDVDEAERSGRFAAPRRILAPSATLQPLPTC